MGRPLSLSAPNPFKTRNLGGMGSSIAPSVRMAESYDSRTGEKLTDSRPFTPDEIALGAGTFPGGLHMQAGTGSGNPNARIGYRVDPVTGISRNVTDWSPGPTGGRGGTGISRSMREAMIADAMGFGGEMLRPGERRGPNGAIIGPEYGSSPPPPAQQATYKIGEIKDLGKSEALNWLAANSPRARALASAISNIGKDAGYGSKIQGGVAVPMTQEDLARQISESREYDVEAARQRAISEIEGRGGSVSIPKKREYKVPGGEGAVSDVDYSTTPPKGSGPMAEKAYKTANDALETLARLKKQRDVAATAVEDIEGAQTRSGERMSDVDATARHHINKAKDAIAESERLIESIRGRSENDQVAPAVEFTGLGPSFPSPDISQPVDPEGYGVHPPDPFSSREAFQSQSGIVPPTLPPEFPLGSTGVGFDDILNSIMNAGGYSGPEEKPLPRGSNPYRYIPVSRLAGGPVDYTSPTMRLSGSFDEGLGGNKTLGPVSYSGPSDPSVFLGSFDYGLGGNKTLGPIMGMERGGETNEFNPYLVGELGPEVFVPDIGRPRMIGMRGPEVVTFDQDGVVIPNHKLKRMKHHG